MSRLKIFFNLIKIFVKNYIEESDERYFLEVDIQYLEKLHKRHNNLPFLPERMKIEKAEKLVAEVHNKTEYYIHIRNLKQALNHGLVFFLKKKKEDRLIKLMNNAVFGKTMEKEKMEKRKKKKKVIGLMKDKLGGEVITKSVGLRAKTYDYLTSDGSEDKKAKTKKVYQKKKS